MSTPSARIKVLIVDDHEVVRRGLRGFLELQDDLEVVGEAEDGAIAVSRADELAPDVILMDLLMPNLDGLGAIAAIHGAHPEIDIVAVTSFIEEEKVTAALEAGAAGYLLKDASADEVADAIRAANAGEVHLDPQVAKVLAQRMRARKDEPPVEALTAREIEVLKLVADGLNNQAIGERLFVSEHTVHRHVANILNKLSVSSRAAAVAQAARRGIL